MQQSDFRPWIYRFGDRLKFDDASFSFVFAEHFMEHLEKREADALIIEIERVLRPGGVVRLSVPDAELRSYEPPEPEGYPIDLPAGHPGKHKFRWSVYSLTASLENAGLTAVPIEYCDQDGAFNSSHPRDMTGKYPDGVDPITLATEYLQRRPSLIIDGIKPPLSVDRSERDATD